MHDAIVISGAVEGIVDEAVFRRLIRETGVAVGPVYGRRGKSHLRQRIAGYNRAALYSPWVVLTDLDRDYPCAPPLVAAWLPTPAPQMRFRVAVHAVESWLLADHERMAQFLGVPLSRLPSNPDTLLNPKAALVELANRSRRQDVRRDLVPRPGSGRAVGPAYVSRLINFAQNRWRPDVAERASDSLRRCRGRLRQFVQGRA